jgi:hypothetical protein
MEAMDQDRVKGVRGGGNSGPDSQPFSIRAAGRGYRRRMLFESQAINISLGGCIFTIADEDADSMAEKGQGIPTIGFSPK